MRVFVTINNAGMKINVGVNVKNWLIKVYVIKDLFGILGIVSECECHKSCGIGEYLDYENCKCRKKLVDKLTEEYTENIEETKLNYHKCSSCTVYRVLFWIFFIFFVINFEITTYFTYYKYMNHSKENVPR